MAVFNGNVPLVFLKLVMLTMVLFSYTAVNGQAFLSSLDFARTSLMKYSAGSERVVDVLTPVRPSGPDLEIVQPIKPGIGGKRGEKGAASNAKPVKPSGGKGAGSKKMGISVSSFDKHLAVKRPGLPRPMGTLHPILVPATVQPKLASKRQRKIYKPRASPSNKFLEALNEIERAVAAAEADTMSLSRQSIPEKLQKLAALIKKATDHRSYRYARALLGQALYLVKQQQPSSGGRSKRASPNDPSSQFLDSLKNQLGDEQFNIFLAVQGDVSLVFAIDDTGSMAGDIVKAKEIAIDVINHERDAPVDYILSPFNDPEPEPSRVIYNDETETLQFVQAINNLIAHAGGDCPELTFKGMLGAIYEGPRWGSPMYVFTDAHPKDATDENIDEVEALAIDFGLTINFFTTGHCGSQDAHSSFQAIASATNGQVFPLSGSYELGMLSGLTGSVLGGSNSISIGSNLSSRKRRSASLGSSQHMIVIDDSIQELTVALTSTNPREVKLLDPMGATITSGKLALSKTAVYQISKPQVGSWVLVVPDSAGQYEFRVKSTSTTNIDFEHFFVLTQFRRGRQTNIPITNPLSGQQAKAVLTVAGVDKVVPSSLNLELITEHGEHIADVSVTSRGGGVHFIATFLPPSQPFRLKLKGTTKKGNAFERISRNVVKPKAGVLRTVRATNEYTLRVGREDRVTLELYNAGPTESFDFTAKDSLGYFQSFARTTVKARSGRQVLTTVRLRATGGAKIGKTDILFVRAKGRTTGVSLTHLVHLLVVD